ncbi:hypothetical protein KIN20_015012 [Parelaphostrongylus tenuis]|uniref:Uncharacterized protein n=1 Tax=Parelaphostrongylus tenuis TaxID=148309 RepID=A0AAD5QLY6_PARTN|nr:hypothetical protein KIN20_015012 [Parelaphostrongylus tenuis]
MISHMLGDGLLSQLVVDPLSVAEGMGVPLSSLGINKTAMEQKFDFRPNATMSDHLFSNRKLSLLSLQRSVASMSSVAATPTTTEKIMYPHGVPLKDYDQFIRNRNLEGHFSTKSPISTTTPLPFANDIAATALDKLKTSMPYSQQSQHTVEKKPFTSDSIDNLNVNTLDSKKVLRTGHSIRKGTTELR